MAERKQQSVAKKALANGTLLKLAEKVESCSFKCQAGYLQLNTDWQTLVAFLKMGKEEVKDA